LEWIIAEKALVAFLVKPPALFIGATFFEQLVTNEYGAGLPIDKSFVTPNSVSLS
jgi:hypothetical protein